MAYSVDIVYMDYFQQSAEGNYDSSPIQNRLKVTVIAAGTALAGGLRTISGLLPLSLKSKKLSFILKAAFSHWVNVGILRI